MCRWEYIVLMVSLLGIFVRVEADSNESDEEPTATSAFEPFACCAGNFPSCRSACENFSLVNLAASMDGKDGTLHDMKRYCSPALTDFWTCMNRTLHAVARGSQWSGRFCCASAISPRCQNACATSASRGELGHGCRQSDEPSLFSCFDRQDAGDECCGNARTSECLQACRDIFRSRTTPTKHQRNLVETVCNDNNTNLNSKVLNCVQTVIDLKPLDNSHRYLPCCDRASSENCTATCKHILNTQAAFHEVIDALEQGGCGPPLPHDPMWQCFISSDRQSSTRSAGTGQEVSQINQIGMDSAKLHCCHKAASPKCRRLCAQTFSNHWTETRSTFEQECYSQMEEITLRQCLDDVDEPCELGCDGLSFCTNFNNRPTELFRSCTTNADEAARSDVAMWKAKGSLSLPGLSVPIKNMTQCSPDTWQAIVCALQIKPCARQKHATQICREDCYDILSRCMDWMQPTASGLTASSICSKLSFEDASIPCISLKPYIEPSDLPHHSGNHRVRSPCSGHRCNSTEVCQVNHDGSNGYTCVPGCPLGETSFYTVPLNTYVRVPVSLKQKGCLKICRCAASGRIENCQPLPCVSYDTCSLSGRRIEHATWFYIECNVCSCFAGEITCTKRQCRIPGISDRSYTSLPCNCPPHHVPVCGLNGNSYPSACVAKCAGLQDSDIEFGPCGRVNPCDGVTCAGNGQCVPRRQVCLSVMQRPCQQYHCVNVTNTCPPPVVSEPACSTKRKTFPSVCELLKSKSSLLYRGPCLRGCRDVGDRPICGINGVTYASECEAWSDYSWMDYDGPCREIGLLSDTLGPRCPSNIRCSPLPNPHCQPIFPPGACCPICAGALRIVYSRKQIDRALYALKGRHLHLLTLHGVLKQLETLIRVGQCRLSGFLTVETDLFVTVQSTAEQPGFVQVDACAKEAEKIATLIENQSHRIASSLELSSLTVANMVPVSTSVSTDSGSIGLSRNLIGIGITTVIALLCTM